MAENVEGSINPSPIPSGSQTIWADASPLLEAACEDLRDGELIHGENFNLFAAMSALEIMDPKMDSGIVCRYYSVDEAIEHGAAPIPLSSDRTVDIQCTIDIMDHLLACEATWHKGYSLAQTIFSCIYLLRPDRTASHALLHSYCRVIRATCNAVISVVSDARTHEEEDLFTMTYGLPLKADGDEKCLSILHAVEETISRQLRACKAQSLKKRVVEDIEPLQTNPDLEEGYCKALLCRIRFRKVLLVQDGKLYGRDPVFAVISKAASLPEVPKSYNLPKIEVLLQLEQLVVSLLKILCANAAWQRRKLGKILQDWRCIYIQLELAFGKELGESSRTLSDELSPSFLHFKIGYNFYTKICKHILPWVEEQTYWIASHFLTLGFELELYSPSEYCMVYWYIYIVLIKLAEKTHLKILTSNETVKRKGKKKKDALKDLSRDYQIPPTVLLLQCHIFLAEGLTMMLAALRNEHNVFTSPGPFNTEHERFIQHFELLLKASIPEHISYFSFKESTTRARLSTLVMRNCFKDAQRIAKELHSSFAHDMERMAELRRIEQVAEHNGVALNLISRLGNLEPSLKVYYEFNHHPYFATAVVKRS
ncbi:uncharacterized protein LOC127794578 isoform X3 [Diospyros lotus]|uniref:uncharacterized protein LOC127794578 isoform X3 n=1 Tax=Diospyros lotus TaxID=55363 RepID=UPI00225677DF|nr:uncharacterized protein LOC127794578 isoform X3 [Diospyros lotus]